MAAIVASDSAGNRSRPGSAHLNSKRWELTTPAGDENFAFSEPIFYGSEQNVQRPDAHQWHASVSAKPPQKRANTGGSHGSSKSRHNRDVGYLAPEKPNGLSRKASELSAASDSDSLLDLYNSRKDTKAPSSKLGGKVYGEEQVDDSSWIHRDKLAEIESRELQQAGINVGRASKSRNTSSSRSGSRAEARREEDGEGLGRGIAVEQGADGDHIREGKRQRLSTQQEDYEDHKQRELRSQSEANAEREYQGRVASLQSSRATGSRLPVSKIGHGPKNVAVDKDSRLPRRRAGSAGWVGPYDGGFASNEVRNRSQSMGSQLVHPDPDERQLQTPPRRSPGYDNSHGKTSSPAVGSARGGPSSGQRKVTPGSRTASGQQKSRVPSNTHRDSPGRPLGTSSGSESRPGTSHNRPEGEAPWIPHMFKPDPRLSQEEQMLPTHAKRLQREQWEKQGKKFPRSDEYDLLNGDGKASPSPRRANFAAAVDDQDEPQWPLTTPRAQTPTARSVRSGTEHGGYKTIPTIPSLQLPSPGPHQRSQASSPNFSETRSARREKLEQTAEPDRPKKLQKEKKGWACCVVM